MKTIVFMPRAPEPADIMTSKRFGAMIRRVLEAAGGQTEEAIGHAEREGAECPSCGRHHVGAIRCGELR